MQFPSPLVTGRLQRRYKRFLADVELADGNVVVAHCADPGRLPDLAVAGAKVWLSTNDDPKRKLRYRLELIEQHGQLVGLNTANANRLVREALAAGNLAEVGPFQSFKPEPRVGKGTRLDFLLERADAGPLYLEVKNITWRRGDQAAFPDTVTTRGTKHLATLRSLAEAGEDAALIFVVQRGDCQNVTIAEDIDPAYAEAFRLAQTAGVRCFAYQCVVNETEIKLENILPMVY